MTGGEVLRVSEFAKRTGYEVSTIRKKLLKGEISYHKPGRIIVIPASEVTRLLGRLHTRIKVEGKG